MPLYRVNVSLQVDSGVAEDRPNNTFWFIADDLTALGLAVDRLEAFYLILDASLGARINTTGHLVRAYDMADPEPRAPVLTVDDWTLTPGTGDLVPEIALCISFQAARQSGQSQARRRGRVYIGPLASAALSTNGYPAAATITQLVAAAQGLLDDSNAASTWSWAVYSRTNQTAISVDNGWVDNAFDVQRRRGLAATSRTTFE